MDFVNGYKSWIGLALGAIAAALTGLEVISPELGAGLGTIAGVILGGGIIHKFTKGQDLMNQVLAAVRDKAAVLAILGFGLGLLFNPGIAVAL